MRVFLSFICSIALISVAPEVHAGKHKDKKSSDSGAASKPAQKAQAKSADWTQPKGGGKGHGRNGGENPNNGLDSQPANQRNGASQKAPGKRSQ